MEIDPEYCNRISSQDVKRIIRALEVYYLTDIPFSVLTKNWNVTRSGLILYYYVIDRSNEEIEERISRRTDEMVKNGLVEEVRELKKLGFDKTLACRQSIGYKEVLSFLDGDIDFGDMIKLINNNTIKLVKKQRKWFRSDKRIKWLLLDKDFAQEDAVALILSEIKSSGGKI
jgi:tRNA dimethylallyltransferase